MALLHPATPPDAAEYHLRETDLGSTRHILTANNATEDSDRALKSASPGLH